MKEDTSIDKHTHVLFFFEDGSQPRYNDVRKFGCVTIIRKGVNTTCRGIMRLGPESLPDSFLLAGFVAGLKKLHRAIKPLLLDQRLVMGLGNICVSEALWEAKIHPERPVNMLHPKEIEQLHLSIIGVLNRTIEAGGITIRNYLNALGESGGFQVALHIRQQIGKPCIHCGTPIVKIKVA